LIFEIEDDPLEVGFAQDPLVLGGGEEERATTEVVDLAGSALGVAIDTRQEAWAEDRAPAAGDVQMLSGVACGFLRIKGF
jgi:hypothetical protein